MQTYPSEPLGGRAPGLFAGHGSAHPLGQSAPDAAPPRADAVDVTREALGQAAQERVHELRTQVAQMLLELEGDLFRRLSREPVQFREHTPTAPRDAPASLPEEPAPPPPGSSTHPLAAEIIEKLPPLLARLAELAPEEALKILARYQAGAMLFPQAVREMIAPLAADSDPSLGALVKFLLAPRLEPVPARLPAALLRLLADPAQAEILFNTARQMADDIRTGGVQTNLTHGRAGVPPARDAMDGITAGAAAPRQSIVGSAQSASPLISPQIPILPGGQAVAVDVDVVSISDTGRGITGALNVDVLVHVNQILGRALGRENPLDLSATAVQVGVQVTPRRAEPAHSPLEALAARLSDRLVDLRQHDPEGFEKLLTLLRALARLNPGKFDQLLAQVENRLGEIAAAQRTAANPLQAPAVAAASVARGEGHVISVTVDVQVNQRMDMVIADLRAAGLDARAVQESSTTQIQVSVRIGSDGEVQKSDPLIIDLQGDGVDVTARETAFDLNADGRVDQSAFVQGDDALLMIDQNGDGRLTDGRELFGDQEGDRDGIAKLARFDDNGDGVIDARDAIFDRLRLVYDKNRDGVTQPDELATLRDVGIASISLQRQAVGTEDGDGNALRDRADVTRTDGSRTSVFDADLTFKSGASSQP